MKYKAYYSLRLSEESGLHNFKTFVVVEQLINVKYGFWIDENYLFTTIESDAKYHIPSSQLLLVEKIE